MRCPVCQHGFEKFDNEYYSCPRCETQFKIIKYEGRDVNSPDCIEKELEKEDNQK